MFRAATAWLCGALLLASPVLAQDWSPDPWLADLAQMRTAVETKYANRDWLERERGVSLDALFDRAAGQLREAGSDATARSVLDRLTRRFADGHVELGWPAEIGPALLGAISLSPCKAMGFDARKSSPGIAPRLPGYAALPDNEGLFAAGTLRVGHARVGVVRIGAFQPQAMPALCTAALAALAIPADKPCDDACQDRILNWANDRMTRALAERLEALAKASARVLIVDISANGGGTEWAEAAARMVSPVPIRSEALGFVRGAHWETRWRNRADGLREAASQAAPEDRTRLLDWAAEADAARTLAASPCAPRSVCIGHVGFATGLVGEAPAGAFAGKPWADLVFSPVQYPYRDSVWHGPLIVLVDDDSWSAAEQFAAVLQDNHAAIILGQRTGGAGCGRTDGGTPTALSNSGAVLELPDCIRFRADGSNEVDGVIPDLPVAMRASDGAMREAKLVEPWLAQAVHRARRLRSAPR